MSFMKPPECDPLGNIIPDSLFYCTGLSILMIYLFSKIPIFHTWIPVSLLCFSVCQSWRKMYFTYLVHVLPIVLACRGLIHACITVENSNVWVSFELVTITSTSPNIILIYISNFMLPYLTNYHQHGYISTCISGCPFFFKFTGPW